MSRYKGSRANIARAHILEDAPKFFQIWCDRSEYIQLYGLNNALPMEASISTSAPRKRLRLKSSAFHFLHAMVHGWRKPRGAWAMFPLLIFNPSGACFCSRAPLCNRCVQS